MLWYAINLFIILIFVSLFIIFKRTNKKWSKINDYLGRVTSTVNSVRYGNLSTKLAGFEHPNYKNLSESINRMVETLNDREKMLIEYQTELTRQNKFLEAVINSLSDGILIIDETHNILRATPQITNWFKENGNNLIGKNLLEYIQTPDEKIEKLSNNDIVIKNNASASFQASTMKLSLEDKKKRFVILIKDITNQKEIEKLKEDFVATLTHDLKVPIIAESNILEFLIEGKFGEITPKQFEAISNMKSCNSELLELVQILLETYKIQASGVEIHKENIYIPALIEEIVFEMEPIAEKTGLKIEFTKTDCPNILADKSELKRVFKNLIQNAISHSETQENIKIEMECDNEFIKISVIDSGKGISRENISQIFNKYYSSVKKFRKIGTGLGLYLSQQIIKAHGGEIIVQSEENVKTEFCVKLPI